MTEKRRQLIDNYIQAQQNFQWAEKEYVRDAIIDLFVAKSELKADVEEKGRLNAS